VQSAAPCEGASPVSRGGAEQLRAIHPPTMATTTSAKLVTIV
jgi:hypothetical protein